jgi:hypothetical protein
MRRQRYEAKSDSQISWENGAALMPSFVSRGRKAENAIALVATLIEG